MIGYLCLLILGNLIFVFFDVISSDVHCEKEDGTSPITAYESASTTECTYTWKDSGSD